MIAPVMRAEDAALELVKTAIMSDGNIQSDPNLAYLKARSGIRDSNEPGTDFTRMGLGGTPKADSPLLGTRHVNSQKTAATGSWLGTAAENEIVDAIMQHLPTVLDDKFKDNLRTLSQYAKAENASPELQDKAAQAYTQISKDLRMAINTAVITVGIQNLLQDKIGPQMAAMVANYAAKPLARASMMAGDSQYKIAMIVVNKALSVVGMKPIEEKDQTLFAAKLVGDFADDILARIDKKKTTGSYQDLISSERSNANQEIIR
jgi:hypothetical protein